MSAFVFLTSLLISMSVWAEVIGDENHKAVNMLSASSQLPHCVNQPEEINAIKSTIKLNSKTENKYNGYRKALASDSDEELMARLIYSETKATNCPQINNEIISVVTSVVSNRVKVRKGDVKSVIFQRDQFASSLNIYDSSKYEDFLCPQDVQTWNSAFKAAGLALAEKTKPTTTTNYFLYKHDPRWTKEPWKLEEDTSIANETTRLCIKAFKNPKFK